MLDQCNVCAGWFEVEEYEEGFKLCKYCAATFIGSRKRISVTNYDVARDNIILIRYLDRKLDFLIHNITGRPTPEYLQEIDPEPDPPLEEDEGKFEKCAICHKPFSLHQEWVTRHSYGEGKNAHASCCELSGKCEHHE